MKRILILAGVLLALPVLGMAQGYRQEQSPFNSPAVDTTNALYNVDTTFAWAVPLASHRPTINPANGMVTVGLTYRIDSTASAAKIAGVKLEYALGRSDDQRAKRDGVDTLFTFKGKQWNMALSDTLHRTARFQTTHDTLLTVPVTERLYFRWMQSDTNLCAVVAPCTTYIRELTITIY